MRAKGQQKAQVKNELAKSRYPGDGVSKEQLTMWSYLIVCSPRCKDKIRTHVSVKWQEVSMEPVCKDSLRTFLNIAHKCETRYQHATELRSTWANTKL